MGLMDRMMDRMIRNMSVPEKEEMMLKMMPMGVSIYETSDGRVDIAAMNLGMMSGMFSGAVQEVLSNGAANLEKTLREFVE